MKLLYYTLLFVILASCKDQKGQQDIGIWHFDVTKEYSKKELYIQDIADVDYIPLETNDSMLWLGREIAFFGDDHIIATNVRTGVLIHNREGEALHSFHRLGGGPEEYRGLYCADYDKEKDEIYILSYVECKFYVFDSKGNVVYHVVSTAKKTNEQIAKEVIKGLWGNGTKRKKKLTDAGYDYNAIQKIVNKLI